MKSRIGAVTLAAVCAMAASYPVAAADFGGDCCADLEERVAELEATTARKGNRKVSLRLYGQVNQAVMFWDDQNEDNVYVVNNKASPTLFGFDGEAGINAEWSAGFRMEIEAADANSDFVDQGRYNILGIEVPGSGDDGRSTLVIRHANWYIDSKRLGRLTIGLQSNSTDNIAEFDLSRTSAVSLSSVETWNEGFFLNPTNGASSIVFAGPIGLSQLSTGAQFQPVIGDLFRGNLDGGRGNLVRYDSPIIAGFIFSADWGEDDDWAVALRYAGEFGALRVAGGIGYHSGKLLDTDNVTSIVGQNAIPDHEEVVGSLSMLHEPTGLFVTFAGGHRNWLDSPFNGIEFLSEKYFYTKAGLLRRFFTIGDTSIYGEYYNMWDVGVEFAQGTVQAPFNPLYDESVHAVGFGVVQHIDAAAMELYLAYRHYQADDITDLLTAFGAGIPDKDIQMDMVMGGARIKF